MSVKLRTCLFAAMLIWGHICVQNWPKVSQLPSEIWVIHQQWKVYLKLSKIACWVGVTVPWKVSGPWPESGVTSALTPEEADPAVLYLATCHPCPSKMDSSTVHLVSTTHSRWVLGDDFWCVVWVYFMKKSLFDIESRKLLSVC